MEYKRLVDEALEAVDTTGDEASAITSIRDGGGIAMARASLGTAMDSLIELNASLAESARDSAAATAASAARMVIGLAGVVIALVLGIAISRTITKPLAVMVAATNELAIGDLLRGLPAATRESMRARRDEVGDVGRALDSLVVQMQGFGEATTRVAAGNLTVSVMPASDRDELGNALSNMVDSLRRAVSQVTDGAKNASAAAIQAAEASAQSGTATSQVAQTTEQVAKGANDAAAVAQDRPCPTGMACPASATTP